MPVSRDHARRIVERLSRGDPISELGQRIKPVPADERPVPPGVPRPADASAPARVERLAFLAKQGVETPHLAGNAAEPDPVDLQGNIEQYIGMTQIPTGLIGPLRVSGLHAHGDFYVPLATTEGTLVASYHRGARLMTRAGGVSCLMLGEQVQRAPAFVFANVADAGWFAAWITGQFKRLQAITAQQSRHAELLDLMTHIEANCVYLIFVFHPGDAAGQNMVTFCTSALCEAVLADTPVQPRYWFLEGNLSGDKKATALSFLQGRGRKVTAEVVLPRRLVERGLRTTPERMCEYWYVSCLGGIQSGSIGVTGHIANGIAALFTACGQDIACVSEASVGITRLQLTADGDLYAGLTLPNLIVGTVGGGTRLPTAGECLRIMGCEGDGKAAKFAEICAAVMLGGEISIIGAFCAGEFAAAHQRLGRPPAG